MARALVFLSYPGVLSEADAHLAKLQFDAGFIGSTGVVVESFQYIFGAAHFVVVLYAPSWADLDQGILQLQHGLNRLLSPPRPADDKSPLGAGFGAVCTTTTVFGMRSNNDLAKTLDFSREYEKLRKEMTDGAEARDPVPSADVIRTLVLASFLEERLFHLDKLCEQCLDLPAAQGLTKARSHLASLSRRLGAPTP